MQSDERGAQNTQRFRVIGLTDIEGLAAQAFPD
jgi:hypothetical protein